MKRALVQYPTLPDQPPDDQWVVVLPWQLWPPHDASFVGYHVEQVQQILQARYGPGRLTTTKTPGLLRWQPENRRPQCDT